MNNTIELLKNALVKIADETAYTFSAELFTDLDEDKTVSFADFAKADDTLEMVKDEIFDCDAEDEDEAIEWWRTHAKAKCAKTEDDPDGYQPADIDRLLQP